MNRNCGMLDILLVNWNAGPQLANVISSIENHHDGLVASVIVVDNASSDNSLHLLEAKAGHLSFPLHIIRNKENRGFGAACNQGAALAKCIYLLFLNPDTELFEASLTKPITFMQQPSNSGIGICGIQLVDEEGNATTSVASFPTLRVMAGKILGLNKLFPRVFPKHLMSSYDLRGNSLVDQVTGAFFLIRKNVFDRCGGFDERFFVYFEEVDLSFRAKQLGYSSYFLSEVTAFHRGGGCSEQVKADRLFYSLRSRILYGKKHYSRMEFVALVLLTGIELPLRFVQGLMRISWSDINNTLTAYMHLVAYFVRRARWD